MAERGDEVAGSIDAGIRQSVEKMVAEIRSSIEDVRLAVDQQLNAALQSIQADVNAVSFLPQIQGGISELQEALASAKPAGGGGAGASRVKSCVQAIERGKSQVDVLNALLEQCLGFGSRAALLILRGEMFSGWKGVGFGNHGGNDESVKRFNATPGLVPELDRVLKNEQVVIWDGANLATRLGVSGSDRAVLVPMVIKDKVSAAVYVDAVGKDVDNLDVESIQLLVFMTGLLIDTLAIRKKTPSPSLTEEQSKATAAQPAMPAPPTATAPHPAPAPPRPAAAPAPAPAPAPPPPAAAIPMTTGSGTVAISAAQMREMMNAPAAAPSAPAPPPPAAAPPAPPPSLPGEDKPSTQYIPPPGLARGTALGGHTDESKKHDEARRFARLLVSEIKLYNETKVDQGRKNNDLYERLKEDIDRSRQMYDERIADDVRKVSNYFYDELVRILADGRAEVLGL
ncbi:MAG TPA: hypothetical protein VF701_18870 [Thermoanaerobaculia bacterium]